MNDKVKIYTGVAVFLGIVLFPVWYNLASGKSAHRPEIIVKTRNLPGKDKCVMAAEYMRTSHMTLLKDWRETVVRIGDRSFTTSDGRQFQRSLTEPAWTAIRTNRPSATDATIMRPSAELLELSCRTARGGSMNGIGRRRFIKVAAAAGCGSVLPLAYLRALRLPGAGP